MKHAIALIALLFAGCEKKEPESYWTQSPFTGQLWYFDFQTRKWIDDPNTNAFYWVPELIHGYPLHVGPEI